MSGEWYLCALIWPWVIMGIAVIIIGYIMRKREGKKKVDK